MLMQLITPVLGLVSFSLTLLVQILDFILFSLADIIGVTRQGVTRLSAHLGRRPRPQYPPTTKH